MDIPLSSGGVVQASASGQACSADGSLTALEQMLTDLGYYHGPIGGTPSLQTGLDVATAMKAFADAHGVSDPQAVCGSIIDAWQHQRSTQQGWLVLGGILLAGAIYFLWRR